MEIKKMHGASITYYYTEQDEQGYHKDLFSLDSYGNVRMSKSDYTSDEAMDVAGALQKALQPVHKYQTGEEIQLLDCVTQTGLDYGGIVVGFTKTLVDVKWIKWSITNEMPFNGWEIPATLIKLPRKNH